MAAQETITSSCPDGIIVSMNAFIDPSNRGAFIKHASAVAKEFRKHENNLFTEISVNPTDAGHVRVVHGWTKDSEWFHTTFLEKPWFQDFLTATTPMWTKPRVIEHFDRVVIE